MLTDEQLDIMSEALTPLFQNLEQEVIHDIAVRINTTLSLPGTAEQEAEAMRRSGFNPKKMLKKAYKKLKVSDEYKRKVAENTADYKRDMKQIVKQIQKDAVSAGNQIVADAAEKMLNDNISVWDKVSENMKEDGTLGQIVKAMQKQNKDGVLNLTGTSGFKGVSGFEPVKDAYLRELNKAMVKVSSGAFTADQAVRSCVKELAQKGIVSIDYASGRTMNLEAAARLCLRTALAQMDGQIVMEQCRRTGNDLVEVTAHWGAREGIGVADHKSWQGKVYSISGKRYRLESWRIKQKIEKLETGTGYPSNPLGLLGYNCRHRMHIFYRGVSRPTQWEPEPQPVTYNGKTYNYTQARSKMRAMERGIQSLKREQEACERLGVDTKEVKADVSSRTREYRKFCKACSMKPQENRLRYEAGTHDLTKTEAWKQYKSTATPERGLISSIINGKHKRNVEAVNAELDGLCYNKSKWSGKVNIDKNLPSGAGRKEWSCDITLAPNAQYDTVCHELLHSRSCSHFTTDDYEQNQIIEESSVELFTEEICKRKGLDYGKSYALSVNSLRRINRKLKLYEDDFDYARELFNVPMDQRLQWLIRKANGSGLSGEQLDYVHQLIGSLMGGWYV